MASSDTTSQVSVDRMHSLDLVLDRVSKLLNELGIACLEVQAAGAQLKEVHSAEAIMKTQALDRVTQTLECLSGFHAKLSQLEGISDCVVSDREFSAVKLDSVKAVLEDRASSIHSSSVDEISLFDD